MDGNFEELVNRLRSAHGDNLISVIVYGSAIAAPGNPRKSDYHILVVAKKLDAVDLRKARPVVRWWIESDYTMPVFFTAEEMEDSLDVYPIEFHHMKRAYQVLYGQDLLAGKQISNIALRWQTEHELRGKLLRLRSLYLPASAAPDELINLMTDSVVSFVRYLRPVLELSGEEPPLGRLATVKRIGEKLKIDTSPLIRVLHLREDPKELMEIEAQDLFASYLGCLGKVIDTVDKLVIQG